MVRNDTPRNLNLAPTLHIRRRRLQEEERLLGDSVPKLLCVSSVVPAYGDDLRIRAGVLQRVVQRRI